MKIKTLINSFSLEEKIAQLCAVNGSELIEDRKICPKKCAIAFKNGIGAICGAGSSGGVIVGGGTAGGDFTAEEVVRIHNELQTELKKYCPHGIPAMMVEECLSGYQQLNATVYPQALSMAATWNPQLMEDITGEISTLLRSTGVQLALSPVLDLVCDPRWGRNEETYGEDPILASAMASAFVKGLQGDSLEDGVAATLKHYLGYGLTEAGRNLASLRAGERLIRDIHLKPFEAALKAGAASVMSAYSDLDGEVITTSKYWLTDVLKEELGFDGPVVCDFGAIDMLTMIFRTARNPEEAVEQAFQAGVDMDFPSGGNYREHLQLLIEKGVISEEKLNESLSRVLKLKEKLGLLKGDAEAYTATASAMDFDTPKQRETAYQAAVSGITLLKRNILPLSDKLSELAVIGPNADSGEALLGDYSYTGGRRGFWWPRMVRQDPMDEVKATSILEEIKRATDDSKTVSYHQGCSLAGNDSDPEIIRQAAAIAAKKDVAILVVGERSTSLSGECRDRHEINLPGRQELLIKEVAATGTPIVLVVLAGRPLDLSEVEPYCSDILMTWYPGDEGGRAIADILIGNVSPGGRLPVSLPRHIGLCPADSKMSLNSGWEKLVGGIRAEPLFPFGHGLTYSDFEYKSLKLIENNPDKQILKFEFTLCNIGDIEAEEVAQVYISDLASSLVQPELRLKTFHKTKLKPQESKKLTLTLPYCSLSFHDRKYKSITEKGQFEIRIGRSIKEIVLRDFFEIEKDYEFNSYFEAEATLLQI